jgi:hypothetical protein
VASNVRHRLASPLVRLRSPLAGCVLLLIGSCLNPQPDPYPQAADNPPSASQAAPGNPNDSSAIGAQSGAGTNDAVMPSASSGAPPSQTPPQPAAPAAQPGGASEPDAGVIEPDGGEPDAAPPANF